MGVKELVAWLRKDWPNPPDHVLARLRHTLDVFDSELLDDSPDDDRIVILATGGVYRDEQNKGVNTGITWGDLRKIREFLEYTIVEQKVNTFKYLTMVNPSPGKRPTIK